MDLKALVRDLMVTHNYAQARLSVKKFMLIVRKDVGLGSEALSDEELRALHADLARETKDVLVRAREHARKGTYDVAPSAICGKCLPRFRQLHHMQHAAKAQNAALLLRQQEGELRNKMRWKLDEIDRRERLRELNRELEQVNRELRRARAELAKVEERLILPPDLDLDLEELFGEN